MMKLLVLSPLTVFLLPIITLAPAPVLGLTVFPVKCSQPGSNACS